MHNLDNTQNKLLLLFVFDKMEIPLSENTLIDLCCQTNNWITYMDCKQALLQLIDLGLILDHQLVGRIDPHLLVYNLLFELIKLLLLLLMLLMKDVELILQLKALFRDI